MPCAASTWPGSLPGGAKVPSACPSRFNRTTRSPPAAHIGCSLVIARPEIPRYLSTGYLGDLESKDRRRLLARTAMVSANRRLRVESFRLCSNCGTLKIYTNSRLTAHARSGGNRDRPAHGCERKGEQ